MTCAGARKSSLSLSMMHTSLACTRSEQGVWYPDSLAPHLAWRGSGSDADSGQCLEKLGAGDQQFFNPFGSVPHLSRVHTFTELLPPSVEHLQWAMPLPAHGEGRGMGGGF